MPVLIEFWRNTSKLLIELLCNLFFYIIDKHLHQRGKKTKQIVTDEL